MQIALYVGAAAVGSVLFFRWAARKCMTFCDESWDASVLSMRIEVALYISFICAVFAYWNYPSVDNVLLAVILWFTGMYCVIFRGQSL